MLEGFNLTKELLFKLFASLDKHRKGYLTSNEWSLQFDQKEDTKGMIEDIKRAIGASFNSSEEVIKFMGDNIAKESFITTIDHILPKRFNQK